MQIKRRDYDREFEKGDLYYQREAITPPFDLLGELCGTETTVLFHWSQQKMSVVAEVVEQPPQPPVLHTPA